VDWEQHLDSHAAHVMQSLSSSIATSTRCFVAMCEPSAPASTLQMSAEDVPNVANMSAEALGNTAILVCRPSKSAAATTAPEAMRHTTTLLLPTAVSAMMSQPWWEKARATMESSIARACSTATHVKLVLLSNWSLNWRTKTRGGEDPENPSQYASSPFS
jgi:hypothetical protein